MNSGTIIALIAIAIAAAFIIWIRMHSQPEPDTQANDPSGNSENAGR